VQKFVDRKFFRVQYNFRDALRKFYDELKETNNINSLAEKIIIRIDQLIPVNKIGIFSLSLPENKLKLIAHKNFDLLKNRTINFQQQKLKTDLSLPVALNDSVEAGFPLN